MPMTECVAMKVFAGFSYKYFALFFDNNGTNSTTMKTVLQKQKNAQESLLGEKPIKNFKQGPVIITK